MVAPLWLDVRFTSSPHLTCLSPLALAGVGGLFGLGCGSNYDLTRDGAKLWSASIPTSATGDVDVRIPIPSCCIF